MPNTDYPSSTKPKAKAGRKSKPFVQLSPDSQYRHAREILNKYSREAIFRAATLAAYDEQTKDLRWVDASYIYKKLQKDPKDEGSLLRKAEKYFNENPSKLISCFLSIYSIQTFNLSRNYYVNFR